MTSQYWCDRSDCPAKGKKPHTIKKETCVVYKEQKAAAEALLLAPVDVVQPPAPVPEADEPPDVVQPPAPVPEADEPPAEDDDEAEAEPAPVAQPAPVVVPNYRPAPPAEPIDEQTLRAELARLRAKYDEEQALRAEVARLKALLDDKKKPRKAREPKKHGDAQDLLKKVCVAMNCDFDDDWTFDIEWTPYKRQKGVKDFQPTVVKCVLKTVDGEIGFDCGPEYGGFHTDLKAMDNLVCSKIIKKQTSYNTSPRLMFKNFKVVDGAEKPNKSLAWWMEAGDDSE
jgi:hypothetical protein